MQTATRPIYIAHHQKSGCDNYPKLPISTENLFYQKLPKYTENWQKLQK